MATTLFNCTYSPDPSETLGEAITNINLASHFFNVYACTPFKWEYLVNLMCVVLWLIIFRWLYDFVMRIMLRRTAPDFTLSNYLTTKDNKALAIDFASFLFAMCLITRGSLQDLQPEDNAGLYFGSFFVYQALGCVVIVVARLLNDKFILRGVSNIAEMVEKESVSVACAQAGTTIATGVIFSAACGGTGQTFGEGIALTLIYWLVGQVFLISYIFIVNSLTFLPRLSPFARQLMPVPGASGESTPSGGSDASDVPGTHLELGTATLFKEANDGNIAAGASIGFDLVHAGILIAAPIYVGYGVMPWVIFVAATLGVVSPIMHLYLDHIVMRGAAYTVSILRHQNWGAAVLMGMLKLLLALLLMMSYSRNCDPSTLYDPPCEVEESDNLFERLGVVAVPDVFKWQTLSNLLILLTVILFSKVVFFMRFALKDGLSHMRVNMGAFSLDATLADPKNNAVAISLASYTFAMGLIVVGVTQCPSLSPAVHAAHTLLWSAIGAVLMIIAFAINDHVLMHGISNTAELVKDNVAIALYESGSFLACGIILRGTLMGGHTYGGEIIFGLFTGGRTYNYAESLALTLLYWTVTQLLLLIGAYVYRLTTFFDDYEELTKGNVAAGISGGVLTIALAIVMYFPIPMYTSLLVFLPIAVIGLIALLIMRKIVDVFVLPGERLDKEIKNDQNWGAAMIEGAILVGIAFVANMYVPTPGPGYVSEDLGYWDICGAP